MTITSRNALRLWGKGRVASLAPKKERAIPARPAATGHPGAVMVKLTILMQNKRW